MISWLILPLLISCTPWQPIPSEKLAWSEHRTLTWDDFRGKPPKSTSFEAQSHCEMDASLDFEYDVVRYEVRCYFRPNEAWTKTNDSYILHHEQLHFDLTEVYARKLRKAFSETPVTMANVGATFRNLVKKYNRALEAEQDRYDRETDHSIDQEAQAEWNELIPQWLEDLEDYADVAVLVELSK